jgi:hypothetical protein
MGFAEHRRLQDWYNPGSMGKQYFLGLEKGLAGSGNPAYPGLILCIYYFLLRRIGQRELRRRIALPARSRGDK